MTIEAAVGEIIRGVPAGRAFDSHYIIKSLIRAHSDMYLRFAAEYSASRKTTLTVHQQIGGVISSFEGTLVDRLDLDSWSFNVHCRPGKCALWRRR